MRRVLFVCIGNAGRSQMAQAFYEELGGGTVRGLAAGCPLFPGKESVDWNLPDPVSMSPDEVRLLRDDIRRRVGELAGRDQRHAG